jgi:hypothetical protein
LYCVSNNAEIYGYNKIDIHTSKEYDNKALNTRLLLESNPNSFPTGFYGIAELTASRDVSVYGGSGTYLGLEEYTGPYQQLRGNWVTMGAHTFYGDTGFHSNASFGSSTEQIGVGIWGTLKVNNAPVTGSDRNIKNSIQNMTNQYEQVFDNIQPVTYKYNDGTSNRTHVGVIAQGVEQAILDAGLTTQDCAIVCYNIDENTGNKKDYGIRYSEIVPLNTWQIQKLKPRMTAAETKIQSLENEIIFLKSEIENLKKSQNSAII